MALRKQKSGSEILLTEHFALPLIWLEKPTASREEGGDALPSTLAPSLYF